MLQAQTSRPAAAPMPPVKPKSELRHAFGQFATGIAVISTLDELGQPYGVTINSFVSVSLEPPMISWNVIRGSTAHTTIKQAGRFIVNVLAKEQQALAQKMTGPIEQRFTDVPYTLSAEGLPAISGALASFECDIHSMITAGDHDIVLGQVSRFDHRDGKPLVYWRGAYATASNDHEPS